MLAVMVMPMLSIEVSAATAGSFYINAGDAGTDYILDTSIPGEETLTVITNTVGSVAFDNASGKAGHVILNSGITIDSIDTNGNVTVNGTVTFSSNTNGNLIVNGTIGGAAVDGNITVNSSGVIDGIANAGTLNVAAGGRVDSVTISGTTTIDGTNLTVQNAAGTSLVPLSAISSDGTITIDSDLTLSGTITQQIFIGSNYGRKTITVLGDTTLSHASGGLNIHNPGGTDLNINSGTLTVSSGFVPFSKFTPQDITINGNIAGDILINDSTYRNVDLNYESGTLTGKIDFDNTGNTVEIGTAATVTGNVEIGGNITVRGTINGDANATAGAINLTPTGVVTGLMSPLPSSNVVIDNLAGGTSANLTYNQYYPVNTANTLGAPQSAAPASGGYIRITTDGTKNILELNNIDLHLAGGLIDATSTTLPLEIYAVGSNTLSLINHDLPITMTAASGGEFYSQIHTTDTFTMQSGTLGFHVANMVSINGITASDIVINGGQMLGDGAIGVSSNNAAALSVKPTINPPEGMMARIMVASSRTNTPTEVAESTDYHLNNYVVISFVAEPNTGTTTYNPAISPQTGVYTY